MSRNILFVPDYNLLNVLQDTHQYSDSDDGDSGDGSKVTAVSLLTPHAMKALWP
jgi:hypothetical protein